MEFYYNKQSNIVEVYIDKKVGTGRSFGLGSKHVGTALKVLLDVDDEPIEFTNLPDDLKLKVLEYYPELAQAPIEEDEFSGYKIS